MPPFATLTRPDPITETERRFRLLARHLTEIRERESGDLARRVHDELGQALTAIRFDLAAINRRLENREPEIQERIRKVILLADDAVQTVRSIAAGLRPGVLDQLGLVAALEWLAAAFQKRHGVPTALRASADTLRASPAQQLALFRIAQEALDNAGRHAHATAVNLRIEEAQDRIVLEVHDNGSGIPPEHLRNPVTFGLLAMEQRAQFEGGEFRVESRSGEGTTVCVILPLHTIHNEDANA